MPVTSEQKLQAVGRSRDREAFAELYAHFAPRVKGFMIKRGCATDLAEELAQETLLIVWRKARQFDPAKASAATWIFTVARNLHIDRVRTQKRPEPDPTDPWLMS